MTASLNIVDNAIEHDLEPRVIIGHWPGTRGFLDRPAVAGVPSTVPEIETARLRLRGYSTDDFAALHRLTSRPETFRFSHRGPMTPDQTWTKLLKEAGQWALFGYGLFAVEDKLTGTLVGEVGFGEFRRGLGPEYDPYPEASWTLSPEVWGRGYALEATTAALRWLAANHRAPQTVCMIQPRNARSLNLAARLEYEPFGRTDYFDCPVILMRRPLTVRAQTSPSPT